MDFQKYWIIWAMITIVVVSLFITIIRGIGNRLNARYVPLERPCPDYWNVVEDSTGKWCETEHDRLKPLADCFSNTNDEYTYYTDSSDRVYKMQTISDSEQKLEIATKCRLPWDGISATAPPVLPQGHTSNESS